VGGAFRRGGFDAKLGSFRAWLFTVVRNRLRDLATSPSLHNTAAQDADAIFVARSAARGRNGAFPARNVVASDQLLPDATTWRPDEPLRAGSYWWQVRSVDPADWHLDVAGLVSDKTPWTVERLRALPQEGQITRHICIEGWSQVGQWSGVLLHTFLRGVGADLRARYVAFNCFDGYSTSLDMASALHPQTILALDFDQQALTPEWGSPLRLRIPIKLGFKSAKNLQSIEVTNTFPSGFWEKQGYNWFSGV